MSKAADQRDYLLSNVHFYIENPNLTGKCYFVIGDYKYYHYLCDGVDDRVDFFFMYIFKMSTHNPVSYTLFILSPRGLSRGSSRVLIRSASVTSSNYTSCAVRASPFDSRDESPITLVSSRRLRESVSK